MLPKQQHDFDQASAEIFGFCEELCLEPDISAAYARHLELAELSLASAYIVAMCQLRGLCSTHPTYNPREAAEVMRRLSDLGLPDAQMVWATLLAEGRLVPQDIRTAHEIRRRLASSSDMWKQRLRLGDMHTV